MGRNDREKVCRVFRYVAGGWLYCERTEIGGRWFYRPLAAPKYMTNWNKKFRDVIG